MCLLLIHCISGVCDRVFVEEIMSDCVHCVWIYAIHLCVLAFSCAFPYVLLFVEYLAVLLVMGCPCVFLLCVRCPPGGAVPWGFAQLQGGRSAELWMEVKRVGPWGWCWWMGGGWMLAPLCSEHFRLLTTPPPHHQLTWFFQTLAILAWGWMRLTLDNSATLFSLKPFFILFTAKVKTRRLHFSTMFDCCQRKSKGIFFAISSPDHVVLLFKCLFHYNCI